MIPTHSCSDLDRELNSYLNDGYRLDMIMPADDPREAIVSKNGGSVRLRSVPPLTPSTTKTGLTGEALIYLQPPATAGGSDWVKGRAGMEYRDLIPGRLDGRVIASHIRITTEGEVPDYVHYHKVQFQMIYCKSGWVSVVYEEGPPFVLNAGDCVLQPPEIRHRVLESSAGAEVIEISSPAIHETWVEHDLQLPTELTNPERDFNGQRFVRFVGTDATWTERDGCDYADTGISYATDGLASGHVVRMASNVRSKCEIDSHDKRQQFIFVLSGGISIRTADGTSIDLETNSCCVMSAETQYEMKSAITSEILQVALPAE